MIKAAHRRWARALFEPYILALMRRHFSGVHLLGDPPQIDPGRPLLLLPNHSTWWDGFFVYLLNRRLWDRRPYLMMLESQLKKNRFFSRLGAFSVNPDSPREVRTALQYTLAHMTAEQEDATLVILFPQGELLPWRRRPLHYRAGLAWLLERAPADIQVVQMAIRAEFLGEQRPAVFLLLSPTADGRKEAIAIDWPAQHEALLQGLEDRIVAGERGQLLLAGRASVNRRFERMRRID